MTTAKYGISAINQINNNSKSGILGKLLFNQANSFRAVRVTSIVLNENHPRFIELGEWNGLGTIEYEDVLTPKVTTNTAKPLLGNNKTLPLVNEIVYLLSLPNNNMSELTSTITSYYINTVSLWNHPHHNAYPTNPNLLPSEQQQDYIQTELGSVRRITDQSSEIYLGNTFVERANIHPLLPFEGDVIDEGRWGNSIRLGSTVANKSDGIGLNNWSTTGSSGDPIIIIRNGQGTQVGDEGWIPVTENINDSDSSIYLTSTQRLPLQASSTSYNSYNTQPQSPSEFSGKQVIINSGRLVFNSNNDHILLTSNQSVGLNAINSVNIDTPLTVIQSDKILLGSKDATESILKGDSLVKQLTNLIEQMIKLNTVLVNVPQVGNMAAGINTELVKIINAIELTKSKVSKTI
jgi:hypothetical protein